MQRKTSTPDSGDQREPVKSLDEFAERMPERSTELVEIDLSPMLGEPDGTTVFAYHEPTTAELFQATSDAQRFARMSEFHGMPATLGQMVATIALAHETPTAKTPPGFLYARMSQKNSRLFMWLVNRFLDAFPHLRDLDEGIKSAKKLSSVE